ncbi:MAG TPA: hypothetical protein VGH73_03270 [Thermoanaerobaculia bacterium]|jgi:hypothetical protein
MRSSTPRSLLTIAVLALLLLPEALFLHRCACGRIFDCCCRTSLKMEASCQLHPGMRGMAHCSGRSSDLPSSVQNRQEPVDRFGTALPRRLTVRLALAGRLPGELREILTDPLPKPPVPPPRLLRAA